MEHLGCYARAWESIMPAVIQNCFMKCGFSSASSDNTDSDEENCRWMELQGHTDCPSTFEEFLNVNKSVPTTTVQLTSLDGPGPSSEHVVGKEEEKMEETWPLPTPPPRKDALMALSVLDSVVNVSDADNRLVKAMDELQDFVSKVYKNSFKQRSIDSYFKK
jgi:hypothetical protein